MNGKSIATFIAVTCGAGLGYLGSCVVRPEARATPTQQVAHIDATVSHEHQTLMDVVVSQRSATPPDSHAPHAALAAGLRGRMPSPLSTSGGPT